MIKITNHRISIEEFTFLCAQFNTVDQGFTIYLFTIILDNFLLCQRLNIDDIKPKYGNSIIEILAGTFREMHTRLVEKENLQKSSLQYISHELKSPIMVIESFCAYACSSISSIENCLSMKRT